MRKITVKINAMNWKLLGEVVDLIGLRRDPYLAKILPGELSEILKQDWANDDAGERYLRTFPTIFGRSWKQVSIMLPEQVADEIDSVANKKRVPRDCLLDAIIRFVVVRILPSALVLAGPRQTLEYNTQEELIEKSMGKLGIESLDEYYAVASPEHYRNELHYTEDSIEKMEAAFESLRVAVRQSRRKTVNE